MSSTGPNSFGTTSGNARELGFTVTSDNASANIEAPRGTTGFNEGMENQVVDSSDTQIMPLPSGTVPDNDTRWDA